MALLTGATALATSSPAPLSAPDLEEAAQFARRAAESAVRGEPGFGQVFDLAALQSAAVGPAVAARLTRIQRESLTRALISFMADTLRGHRPPTAQVISVGATGTDNSARVALLIPAEQGLLKTEWELRNQRQQWRVEDVRISDFGQSLLGEAVAAMGDPSIAVPRRQAQEARRAATPRIAGLLAVVAVTILFYRRLRGRQRVFLLAAAAGPFLLFALDGTLAVSRIVREPVELHLDTDSPRSFFTSTLRHSVERGDLREAITLAARARAAGMEPQPTDYLIGHLAEKLRNAALARELYQRALAPPHPAPGAWAGLARLAMNDNQFAPALDNWEKYLSLVPPDPVSLALEAVCEGKLSNLPRAQQLAQQAIDLDPTQPGFYALSARLAAGSGDASGAVGYLRQEEKLAPLDRQELASDPAFAPIASNSVWQDFLTEPPARR